MIRRSFLTVLFFGLICTALGGRIEQVQTPAAVFIEKIAQSNLSSFKTESVAWTAKGFKESVEKACWNDLNPLPQDRRRSAYNLLKLDAELGHASVSQILDDQSTWEDLALFVGKTKETCSKCFANVIDRSITEIGRAVLVSTLAQPVDDVPELQKRQGILHNIMHDQAFAKLLDRELEKIVSSESLFLSLYGHDLMQGFVESRRSKPPFEFLNNNQFGLEFKQRWDRAKDMFLTTGKRMYSCATIMFWVFYLMHTQGVAVDNEAHEAMVERGANGDDVAGAIYDFMPWDSMSVPVKKSLGVLLMAIGGLWLLPFHIDDDLDMLRGNQALDKFLHFKMRSIAQIIQSGRTVWDQLKENRFLVTNMPAANTLRTFYSTAIYEKAELKELCQLLETDTFKEEYSSLLSQGKVIRAYFLLEACKNELAQLYVALGQIDAYAGMTRLMKEFDEKPVRFTFAHFDTGATPYLALKRFWNPFISPNKVVPNNLSFGRDHNTNNIIVTGPNAAGKSTIMRSVLYNIVLAQTFGIAAADYLKLTPFSLINTYFSVTDDIASGNSLFKAQIMRAFSLVKRINALPRNKFAFTAADELFNGTSPREAMGCAYSVAQHIGSFDNGVLLIATHFDQVTDLAKTGRFSNYRVRVDYDEHGVVQCPFKIEPGASHQNIAIDLLKKEGYSGTIIDTAQALVRQAEHQRGKKDELPSSIIITPTTDHNDHAKN